MYLCFTEVRILCLVQSVCTPLLWNQGVGRDLHGLLSKADSISMHKQNNYTVLVQCIYIYIHTYFKVYVYNSHFCFNRHSVSSFLFRRSAEHSSHAHSVLYICRFLKHCTLRTLRGLLLHKVTSTHRFGIVFFVYKVHRVHFKSFQD